MSMEVIGLVLDGLMLIFLAATIFVAWRLSDSLTVFRKTRKEMDGLVIELSRNIEKAELAITGLKGATRDSGRDLQKLVSEARALSDELQLMTESGDNLASRLERLAERNRDIAERIERSGGAAAGAPTRQPGIQRVQEEKRAALGPAFAIRDRDADASDDETIDDGFQTRAERELFAALGKKPQGGA